MSTPLRIGVLGASRIAENAIVGPAHALGHRLVAVAARDPRRAQAFADKHGVERVVGTYQELVEDPDVDVVYNPLANSLHAPWNLAALRAGKPVLTEKPFARNADEARSVRKEANASGIPVVEGFHYLFHPVTRRLLELLRNGTLGELQHVEVVMRMPEPAPGDPRWSRELAGGAVMDLGCYGLHASRMIGALGAGKPAVVSARAVERTPGIDESCDIDIEFPSGATGSSRNSMTAEHVEMTMRIVGSSGQAWAHNFIDPTKDDRVSVTDSHGTRVEHLGNRPTYTYQLEAFAAHIQGGAELPFGADDAVENMELVDAAYRAAGLPLH